MSEPFDLRHDSATPGNPLRNGGRLIFRLRISSLSLSVVGLVLMPRWAPLAVLLALILATFVIQKAARARRGTALGPAVRWAALTTFLGLGSQCLAIAEPLGSGRPLSGILAYVMTLTAFASLISVLNARTPGAGPWAILNAMLVLVFLIPWLEGGGHRGAGHRLTWLRLDNPWTIFYGLLVMAGVTNYLPTRYGPAAALLALGFGVEYYGLTHPEIPRNDRALLWSIFPLAWAAALTAADQCSQKASIAKTRLEAIWFLFRDHWGVVWALRIQERFNRSAEGLDWPARLSWQGVVMRGDEVEWDPAEAEALLRGLLRRFLTEERLAEALGTGSERPCQRPGVR